MPNKKRGRQTAEELQMNEADVAAQRACNKHAEYPIFLSLSPNQNQKAMENPSPPLTFFFFMSLHYT